MVRMYSYIPRCNRNALRKRETFINIFKDLIMETKKQPTLHNSKHEPFKILEQNGKFQITLGNAIISEKVFKRKQDAEMYLGTKPYKLIINAACYCMEQAEKSKEHENK